MMQSSMDFPLELVFGEKKRGISVL